MTDYSTSMRLKLPVVCIVLEIILIILFGVFVEYNDHTDANLWHKNNKSNDNHDMENEFYYRYPSKYVCEHTLTNATSFDNIHNG